MAMQVGSNAGVKSDINVTPLIDVVLVLLIIFMVITPMLTKGMPVQLPQGTDPAKKPDDQKDLILSIKEDESFYLTGEDAAVPQTLEAIETKLKELNERDPSIPMYIKADRRLKYGVVKKAMLTCEAAGFRSVALVAEQPK